MTNVHDLNFVTSDPVKDEIAQVGNDDDASVGLVGCSPRLGMIGERIGKFG
jgi:hypothetical protein